MVFRKVVESVIHDSAPGNICAGLQQMGINAQIAARGRYEEKIGVGKIGGGDSLGIIDIPEGLIRWINVRRVRSGGGGPAVGTYHYFTDYGVPDPKLGPDWRGKEIRSVRVKTFPLFGKVVELRWKGDDSSQKINHRLS